MALLICHIMASFIQLSSHPFKYLWMVSSPHTSINFRISSLLHVASLAILVQLRSALHESHHLHVPIVVQSHHVVIVVVDGAWSTTSNRAWMLLIRAPLWHTMPCRAAWQSEPCWHVTISVWHNTHSHVQFYHAVPNCTVLDRSRVAVWT